MRSIFNISTLLLSILFFGIQHQAFAQTNSNQTEENTYCTIYMPNAFSPNGDNVNDRFVIKTGESCALILFELQIFDRWGRMVFESKQNSEEASWDGKFNNDDLQEGVYMYKLRAILKDNENPQKEVKKVSKQGSLILVR